MRREGWSRDEQEALQEIGTSEDHRGAAQGLPGWIEQEIGAKRRPKRRTHTRAVMEPERSGAPETRERR